MNWASPRQRSAHEQGCKRWFRPRCNDWKGTCLDCALGRAISHDLLPAPLLVLHLDHATELLVRRSKHGNFNSVGQASIFDRGFRGVSGFLALVEEFLSSWWYSSERF